jgi:hypothetical protein
MHHCRGFKNEETGKTAISEKWGFHVACASLAEAGREGTGCF